MSCYITQEIDGSRFSLEDASGFLVLEDCAPVGGVDAVMGGVTPARNRGGPFVRGTDRREILYLDEDLVAALILSEEL